MDMMMGQFLGPDVMRSLDSLLMPPAPIGSSMAFSMLPMDIEETDKEYIVSAEVPGFSKDDLKASLSPDGILTVQGEHKEEKEEGEKQRSRRMKFSQSFNRR
jgi:HSP20 family molecular chaperone IbpA